MVIWATPLVCPRGLYTLPNVTDYKGKQAEFEKSEITVAKSENHPKIINLDHIFENTGIFWKLIL